MTHYLIEFRFSGNAKKYLKELIYDVSKTFNVKGATRRKPVPHISLAGPLYTNNERRLVKEVVDVVRNYDMVEFSLVGFGKFGNWLTGNRVIKVDIEPSKELEEIRLEIAKKLKDFCKMTEFDNKKNFKFHTTIAFKDIDRKFGDIWDYIKQKQPPKMSQYLLRITIIKNQEILCEYDLMLKKFLTQRDALNRDLFRKTLGILKRKLENSDV